MPKSPQLLSLIGILAGVIFSVLQSTGYAVMDEPVPPGWGKMIGLGGTIGYGLGYLFQLFSPIDDDDARESS